MHGVTLWVRGYDGCCRFNAVAITSKTFNTIPSHSLESSDFSVTGFHCVSSSIHHVCCYSDTSPHSIYALTRARCFICRTIPSPQATRL